MMTLRGPFDGTPPEAGASPAEDEKLRAPRDGGSVTLAGPGAPLIVGAGRLDADFGERYQQRELIARGGMGEIWLCADQRIGRDVAMKAIRDDQGDDEGARARFEREARVQAQLEHPAIVPVYELGLSPEREVFFTMRHVHGKTLAEIIAGLRFEASCEDRPFEDVYSRHRLLTAFNQLCLAIDYAHSRGVIHRDLKPANVMLGSYGEVHVIDWGIAKLAHHGELPPSSRALARLDPGSFTDAGEAMGTPGYMPPEQARDAASVDERADVFALGAILFEILTLEPLCPKLEREDGTDAWGPADPRASVRAPHRAVPPELEVICAMATAPRPEDRYPSARKLQEAVERYLEGDRDLQVRKSLAERHVQEAKEAALRAWEPGEQGIAARDRALHELGAALALDQGNQEALDALERLLGEARAAMAPEVHAAIEEAERPARRVALRGRLGGHALTAAMLLCALAFGVRDARAFAAVALAIAVATGATTLVFLREDISEASMRWRTLIGALPACAFSLWLGPLIIVPTIAAVNAVMIATFGAPGHRRIGVAGSVLALAIPYAAQAAGWMEPSYVVRGDGLLVLPRMTGFPPEYTVGALLLIHLALIIMPAVGVARLRDRVRLAEQKLQVEVWNLRQLVPREAYEPLSRTSDAPETGRGAR